MPKTTSDERDHNAALVWLREQHKLRHATDGSLFGSATNTNVARLAMIGFYENKPPDLSDLAKALVISRKTAGLAVAELQVMGWVHTGRDGRRRLVFPTPNLVNLVTEEFGNLQAAFAPAVLEERRSAAGNKPSGAPPTGREHEKSRDLSKANIDDEEGRR
jgi:DNA-binding MarR family transcriptional regulator